MSSRVAVVTGGAGAVGRAVAERLAGSGHLVHLVDRSDAAADVAAKVNGIAHLVDVTDDAQVEGLAAIGPVDVLVNSVGAWPLLSVDDLVPVRWRQLLDLNLTASYVVTHALLAGLRERRGSVVNLSSGIALKGHPLLIHYAAAKAGLLGMTKALALALGPDGVRVNAVAPGLLDTEANLAIWGAEARERFRSQRALDVDLHVDDVADAVAFLASDSARTITGQTLVVDGGTVLH